jgi:ribonuclease HII
MIELELLNDIPAEMILASDEVGRGSLMGQVVTGTLIWKDTAKTANFIQLLRDIGVKDSKKVSDKKRVKILKELGINIQDIKTETIYSISYKEYSFEFVLSELDAQEIDKININQATFKCFNHSYDLVMNKHKISPVLWLIDGDKLPSGDHPDTHLESIIKGDQKSALIGLAAIIAKEYRDYTVQLLSLKYPMYEWSKNAGYGTKSHLNAIGNYGLCEYHRKSFCKNF